ncbi:MAG: methylenetetrahydrofolate dehydrogenase (NADP+) / methenyltetrahydrofolate cyclohydrolase [Spirochaetes bacterium]|nr:MAG: methylenetetrahydrofolate dehydrogenase (NADP+) / methenyltetrahydrofolate cyclohydrolase [Spirochaetota bacterium]
MAAKIIEGKTIAKEMREEIAKKVAQLATQGVVPGLGVLLVGMDPASISYVTAKEKACAEAGMASFERRLPADSTQEEVLAVVREFNADDKIHGILVQLPLPKHIDERAVIATIAPEKDVDGFTPINVGRMILEESCYVPCTPAGVIEMIKRSGVPTSGVNAVVVGRSNIVGKPLANLLIRKSLNATVTICHTGTKDLPSYTKKADILIACAGRAGLITGDMIKPGACVIDVGVNRVEDPSAAKGFRLKGDVDFDSAAEVAGWISPVPGGVGPMTITLLLANTVEAAARKAGAVSGKA